MAAADNSSAAVDSLPADLFHLISAELSARQDYATLYSCILSSKQVASAGFISALYRISHEAPVKGGGSETVSLAEQDLILLKWTILWRSIVLSALGKAAYPYCRHLRMLDLRDLSYLLDHDKFRNKNSKIAKYFFAGELARFRLTIDTPSKAGSRLGIGRLDSASILSAIGDTVTQAAPLLEALSEPTITDILSTALLTWAPQLKHLRFLQLWDGKALADETLRNLLHVHCPALQQLSIYRWTGEDSDHQLATFIAGMQPNTLTYFENISSVGIGGETTLALNDHGKSLRTLKLALADEGILALGYLRGCTAIESLSIGSLRPSVDLKATQNDVYLEIVEWLRNCKSLADVKLENIVSAPDLLTPMLLESNIHLEELQIKATEGSMYLVKDHHDFHQSLANQPTLRRLLLRADPEAMSRDDIEKLMNAFCSLTELRELNLTRISDFFSDEHIKLLASHLPNLEELYIGGYGISDAVWGSLATLPELKTLTFSGLTNFTEEGIVAFIDQLDESNQGFALSVDMADTDSAIPQASQDSIREALSRKLEGRFEYQLLRGQ
ncbi:hypothetical protein MBLNU230_g3427t2 [Neophaeotheca triangularis]